MRRPRALFVCGSLHQTAQMRSVAEHLADWEVRFTPYYCDGIAELVRRAGFLEMSILGERLRRRCKRHLIDNDLPLDMAGATGGYDLAVTCSDLVVPRNLRQTPLVAVQEGMTDPPVPGHSWLVRAPLLRPLAGTAATGLSGRYDRFCVASEGYRRLFVSRGAPPDRVAVTGIPVLDDCARWLAHPVPLRDYVLVCTSDSRETFRFHDRPAFLARARKIAGSRKLVFKLHPNERVTRACAEIRAHCPSAIVVPGPAEPWIAHCDALITERSSLTFVGLALGKETHSDLDLEELRSLLPLQHGRAAELIAAECRAVLTASLARSTSKHWPFDAASKANEAVLA